MASNWRMQEPCADCPFNPTGAGLDLACWCPLSRRCHVDILLEIANA